MPVPVRYAKGMTNLHLLALIAFAMFLGALIGFERELADKPAGLRTHMLVAGGATLLVSLGDPLDQFLCPRRLWTYSGPTPFASSKQSLPASVFWAPEPFCGARIAQRWKD
ncbi:MAG: MgtC/SapB family protein [Caldilineaceae bacterium]